MHIVDIPASAFQLGGIARRKTRSGGTNTFGPKILTEV
jgi:hypothetical protein